MLQGTPKTGSPARRTAAPVHGRRRRRPGESPSGLRSLRHRLGLSQDDFAALLGVSRRTLENWEQGTRVPSGPAQALLALVEASPGLVLRHLRGSPPDLSGKPAGRAIRRR